MSALPRKKTFRVLPGFGLSLGFTVFYLSIIVLIPISAMFLKTAGMTWPAFWEAVASPRVVASYRLTFGASFVAAVVNAIAGLLVAWVLVRYAFPGKKLVDSLVDLPFALPTAVAGIALTQLYAPSGWVGQIFAPGGFIGDALGEGGFIGRIIGATQIETAFSPLGVTIALTFIGLPFVVRTLQPVLEDLNPEIEQAAATLGATRLTTFTRVIFPEIWPALLTGFALAFARAVGEYGSVVFIAGNMPMKTEITPLIIITKLEQYDYRGATAVAVVMLLISFALLLIINLLQRLSSQRFAAPL